MNFNKVSKGKLKYDADYIKSCSEIELFIQINSYYELLTSLKLKTYYHKMKMLYQKTEDLALATFFAKKEQNISERMLSDDQIRELEETLDFCIFESSRFNTGVYLNSNGIVEKPQKFYNWYDSWSFYIQNMDDETLLVYRKCRYEGKGLNQFQLKSYPDLEAVEEILEKPKVKQYLYATPIKNIRQKLA